MDDKRLDQLLKDAARTYRVAPELEPDAMWTRVEREAFDPPVRRATPSWRIFVTGVAASLLVGVIVGRMTVRVGDDTPFSRNPKVAVLTPVANSAPYQHATEEFLGRTALLFAALPAEGSRDGTNAQLSAQASQLLTTTRLLLDSPVAGDARMKQLLEDLELVLAQVSRLPAPHNTSELSLITQALEERDLVPRIRSAVVDLSGNEY
jgi:hypothetical protein